jgi:opacity protein-like surface antigen
MNALHKIAFATAILGASAAVQADNFVGLTWGETSNNVQKSSQFKQNISGADDLDKVINNTGTWGIRAGQNDANARYYLTYEHVSDSHSMGIKMRQENLLASYDLFLPLGDTTRLFGGATLGLTKLSHDITNANHDSDIGYAAGLQAGILQNVGSNASLEAGYRYLRSNASLDVKPQDAGKVGSLDLHSSSQVYLGANYRF